MTHSNATEIRKLAEADAAAYWSLRLEALQTEPLAFGTAAEEHLETSAETYAKRFRDGRGQNFYLGAFVQGVLAGTVTFVRETKIKERHKGHIYGVYVTARYRGQGLGRGLLRAALAQASEDATLERILLSVAAHQQAAVRLYTGCGFTIFGTEQKALKVGTQYVDEHHMVLKVR